MKDFTTYLSTAPVVSFLYFGFLAGLLIEINRFFPDALVFPFLFFLALHFDTIIAIFGKAVKLLSTGHLPPWQYGVSEVKPFVE